MHLFHDLHARRNGREDVIRFLPAMSLECTKLAIARRQGPCMTAASAWLRVACFFGSAEGQSDVSHRCARVYIIASFRLVIQATELIIKFTFPWRPDQAGMASAPMEKWTNNSIAPYIKTHAHMHPRTTGRHVNVGAFAHTRVIRLFHRCGLQGQSGFRHFQTFSLGALALPWLSVPRIKNIHDIQIFPGPGVCVCEKPVFSFEASRGMLLCPATTSVSAIA